MKISLMRFLDYWCGIPLCCIASVCNRLNRAVFPRRKTAEGIRSALFVKLSELGAIVLAYPLLSSVRSGYPQAELYFVTYRKNKDVFTVLGDIVPADHVFLIREDSFLGFAIDTLKVLHRCRRLKIDVVFDLEFFSRFTALFSCWCGAVKSVGFHRYTFEGLYRGDMFTHKVAYNPLNHVVVSYLSLLQDVDKARKTSPELSAAIPVDAVRFPVYRTSDAVRIRLERTLSESGWRKGMPLFLMNAGEGVLPLREWPVEHFISVATLLLSDPSAWVVLVGTEGATAKAATIVSAVKEKRCINLVGSTSILELEELFLLSTALISNDCGLAHLAMLSPIHTFIMFGPETPQVFGPQGASTHVFYAHWPCSPCLSALNNRDSRCRDNQCLKAIRPEHVYAQIQRNR